MQRWGLLIVLAACSGEVTGPAGGDGGNNGNTDGRATGDGAPRADAPGGVGEPPELTGITLYHNEARAAVDTQSPLPALEWDPQLANIAAAWVAQCKDTEQPIGLIDHNPNRSDGYPTYVGENIFASGGTATARQAVDLWMSEKANYDYANNACNGTCGHYTQIVWRQTTKLGCAIGNCPGLTYPSSLVCDYGPGGNNGNRPY